VRDLVPLDRTFEPDERTRDVYDRLFAEFPKLYQAQKGFFGRLNRPPR
jgi:xylulokinase